MQLQIDAPTKLVRKGHMIAAGLDQDVLCTASLSPIVPHSYRNLIQ